MKIIIMRHAHRDDIVNPAKYISYGSKSRNNDCSISVLGGTELCVKYRKYFDDYKIKINEIYVSPFKRTLQTANVISTLHEQKFNLIPKQIISYNLCEIQNGSPPNFSSILLQNMKNHNINYPETINDIITRINTFYNTYINKYMEEDKTIMIVSHKTICEMLTQLLVGIKYMNNKNITYEYGDSYTFEYFDNDWVLLM